jgi:hypothetical protein
MKNITKMENIIMSVAAFACYLFALTVCGTIVYALMKVSLIASGNLGQGFNLDASQF